MCRDLDGWSGAQDVICWSARYLLSSIITMWIWYSVIIHRRPLLYVRDQSTIHRAFDLWVGQYSCIFHEESFIMLENVSGRGGGWNWPVYGRAPGAICRYPAGRGVPRCQSGPVSCPPTPIKITSRSHLPFHNIQTHTTHQHNPIIHMIRSRDGWYVRGWPMSTSRLNPS